MAVVTENKLPKNCPETQQPMRWDIDRFHHGVCAYREKCRRHDCISEYDFSPIIDPFGRDKLKPIDREIIQATKVERWRETIKGNQKAKEVIEKMNSLGKTDIGTLTLEKPAVTVTPQLTNMPEF
jgi:hypothetical protein